MSYQGEKARGVLRQMRKDVGKALGDRRGLLTGVGIVLILGSFAAMVGAVFVVLPVVFFAGLTGLDPIAVLIGWQVFLLVLLWAYSAYERTSRGGR